MDEERRLAVEINVAFGRIVRRLRQAHVPGDITLSEASVLARLESGTADTPGGLAHGEHVSPQAMGVTLTGLEDRKMVTRTPDPSDGRRVIVRITEGGRLVMEHRRDAKIAAVAAALASGFTAEERARLADATPLLLRLADLL